MQRHQPISTKETADEIGCPVLWMDNRIRHGQLEPPPKVGQSYLWWPEDVERARKLWEGWGKR